MRSINKYLLLSVLFIFCNCTSKNQKPLNSISKFGEYKEYSVEYYHSWNRTSQYVEMSDGIKLAVDIIRPVKDDILEQKKLPVVWEYFRYHRAIEKDGVILSLVERELPLQKLLKHGYVIVVVDARGTGASFGIEDKGPNTLQEAQHTYEITEWIAKQDWCDGNVGMSGHSYSGNVQMLAASQRSPHLKAIFPSGTSFDVYEILYSGGVMQESFVKNIDMALTYYDKELEGVPVDRDSNRVLVKEALKEHQKNLKPLNFFKSLPYRDSKYNDYAFWLNGNPHIYLDDINKHKVPVYQWFGWQDFLIKDGFLWHINLKGPKKMSIGWWSHGISSSYDLWSVEQLRWFDYWLKNIDNGIMDEPEIYFVYTDENDSLIWNQTDVWPPKGSKYVKYKFIDNFSETNDLEFTTEPLNQNLTIVGHPVVSLPMINLHSSIDLSVSLNMIDKSGNSTKITDGMLRASHSKISKPPFKHLGLPYHRHFEEDIIDVNSDEIYQFKFDLLPIAKILKKGYRIQVVLEYEDFVSENQLNAPEILLDISSISLPIIQIE